MSNTDSNVKLIRILLEVKLKTTNYRIETLREGLRGNPKFAKPVCRRQARAELQALLEVRKNYMVRLLRS